MKISILTMFPEMLASLENSPITKHAAAGGKLSLDIVDIRKYADGSYRHIDDSPYGGGAGMIMRCTPVLKALSAVKKDDSYVVCPIPAGYPFTEKKAEEYAGKKHLILIAGHYEGMDARIYNSCDELVSMGDYIVSAGEYACMMIADSCIRLLDGVIKKESVEDESFANGLLEYPQYTRPYEYEGKKVPEVLLSGDHEKIRVWRLQQSLLWTEKYRPDLLAKRELSIEERCLLFGEREK